MGSLAILRRCISRSRALGIFTSAASFRSLNSATNRGCGVSSNKSIPPSGPRPRLMLPPPVLDGDAEVVGSSHGWVAFFNKRSNDLFLSDPLSHRRIKLPPIHTLPDPYLNLDLEGHGSVSKVILSTSPDDDDCRAMMTFGPANRLAFCLPGRSSEWTPIGDLFFNFDHHCPFESAAMVHEDLVYCSRRRVFTSITAAHLDFRYFSFKHLKGFGSERYDWDIQDPNSPKIVRSQRLSVESVGDGDEDDDDDDDGVGWLEENMEVMESECVQIPHLVYAEHSDKLFLVLRFVRLMKEGEGGVSSPLGFVPSCEVRGLSGVFPGKTFGFIVMEMSDDDKAPRICRVVEDDLNGMSMFVGINHSFAFAAFDDDEFKPNSIYFSDAKRIQRVCGLNDNGVFDYATKTISPLSLDHAAPTQTFKVSPFWFSNYQYI